MCARPGGVASSAMPKRHTCFCRCWGTHRAGQWNRIRLLFAGGRNPSSTGLGESCASPIAARHCRSFEDSPPDPDAGPPCRGVYSGAHVRRSHADRVQAAGSERSLRWPAMPGFSSVGMVDTASLGVCFDAAAAFSRFSPGDKRTALSPSFPQRRDRCIPSSIALCAVSLPPGRGSYTVPCARCQIGEACILLRRSMLVCGKARQFVGWPRSFRLPARERYQPCLWHPA
jgi:hypothetical protein